MGLRESINQSPKLGYGVLAVIGLVLVASVVWQFSNPSHLSKAWFTVDDGATWFTDDIAKVPPFEVDGKTAVGCQIYTCDGGKTTFAAFLYRYRPEAKAKFAALKVPDTTYGEEATEYTAKRDVIEQATREVKRPKTGNEGWLLGNSGADAADITRARCPTPGGQIEPVIP